MIRFIFLQGKEISLAGKTLKKTLESSGFSEFTRENGAEKNNGKNGVKKNRQRNEPDLVVLDQPLLKEADLIKLRAAWPVSMIAILTKSKELAWKAYELDFEDYLISPLKKDRVFKSILKIKNAYSMRACYFENADDEFFFIREKEALKKLKISEINFIQAFGDYIHIYAGSRRITIHLNLKYVIKRLPGKNFIRVHKSFIINLDKVDKIQGNSVFVNSHQVPVGDAFRKELNKNLNILK